MKRNATPIGTNITIDFMVNILTLHVFLFYIQCTVTSSVDIYTILSCFFFWPTTIYTFKSRQIWSSDFSRCRSLWFLDLQLMLCHHDARIFLQRRSLFLRRRCLEGSQNIWSALHVRRNANLIDVMQCWGQVLCHSDEQCWTIIKLCHALHFKMKTIEKISNDLIKQFKQLLPPSYCMLNERCR